MTSGYCAAGVEGEQGFEPAFDASVVQQRVREADAGLAVERLEAQRPAVRERGGFAERCDPQHRDRRRCLEIDGGRARCRRDHAKPDLHGEQRDEARRDPPGDRTDRAFVPQAERLAPSQHQ
jgi:hypothetical protein